MNVRVCCILYVFLYSNIGANHGFAADLDEDRAGYLFSRESDGGRLSLPLKATWVGIDLSPGIVETTVSQVYSNESERVLECTYLFPLPDGASVTSMTLRYADRVVESVVKEKQEAKRTYEQAKATGKKAALVEKYRSNLFSSSVANFAPGETVEIRFSYVEQLEIEKGKIQYRLPLVAEKNYFPPVYKQGPRSLPEAIGEGAGKVIESLKRSINKLDTFDSLDDDYLTTIDVVVTGIPIREMYSSSHRIEGTKMGEGAENWELAAELGVEDLSRDFVMKISLEQQTTLEPRLLVSETDTGVYGGLTFFPPSTPPKDARGGRGRDVIFLIDHSGSMGIERMENAREGVAQCLMELRAQDRFNIVVFDDTFEFYSDKFVVGSESALARGVDYARSIESEGGTIMQPALSACLDSFDSTSSNEKLVVFLTDGAVGNESDLITLLRRKLGDARLFTFGIGRAPNEFLVKQMASAGRGQARFIMEDSEVVEEIASLFQVLDTPYLSDVELTFFDASGSALDVEYLPFPVANVYAGHPVQIVFRSENVVPDSVVLTGERGGRKEKTRVDISQAARGPKSLEVLFGRHLIDRLMLGLYGATDTQEREKWRREIVDVSMLFQLVTEFTSRVAVEQFVSAKSTLDQNTGSLGFAAQVPGQVARYSADQDAFELSPFTVSSGGESGYRSMSTTSGSRLGTSLKDVSASISVLTEAFLEDVAATTLGDALQFLSGVETRAMGGDYLEFDASIVDRNGSSGGSEFEIPELLLFSRVVSPGTPASAVANDFDAGRTLRITEKGARFRSEAAIGVRVGDQGYNAVWAEGTADLKEDKLAVGLFLSRSEIATSKESARFGVSAKLTESLSLQTQVRSTRIAGFVDAESLTFQGECGQDDMVFVFESSWSDVDVLDPFAFGIEYIGTPMAQQLAADGLHSLSHLDSARADVHSASVFLSREGDRFSQDFSLGVSYRNTDREMVFGSLGGDVVSWNSRALSRRGTYRIFEHELGLSLDFAFEDTEWERGESDSDQLWNAALVWRANDWISFVTRYAEMENTPQKDLPRRPGAVGSQVWARGDGLEQVESRGIDLMARFSVFDDRFASEIGFYKRSDSGSVFRDWNAEKELLRLYMENGYDWEVDVLLRNDGRVEGEGMTLRFAYSPTRRFSLRGWYETDWGESGRAFEGGTEGAALMSRFVLWDGSSDLLTVGGGLRYRSIIRFNDGFELADGVTSNFFARYEFGDYQNRSIQVNVSGLGGKASQRSRFDNDRGAQSYLTFRQEF